MRDGCSRFCCAGGTIAEAVCMLQVISLQQRGAVNHTLGERHVEKVNAGVAEILFKILPGHLSAAVGSFTNSRL